MKNPINFIGIIITVTYFHLDIPAQTTSTAVGRNVF